MKFSLVLTFRGYCLEIHSKYETKSGSLIEETGILTPLWPSNDFEHVTFEQAGFVGHGVSGIPDLRVKRIDLSRLDLFCMKLTF